MQWSWNFPYSLSKGKFRSPFTYWYKKIPEMWNFWRFKLELKVPFRIHPFTPDSLSRLSHSTAHLSPWSDNFQGSATAAPLSWPFTASKFAPFRLSWLTSGWGAGLTSNLIEGRGRECCWKRCKNWKPKLFAFTLKIRSLKFPLFLHAVKRNVKCQIVTKNSNICLEDVKLNWDYNFRSLCRTLHVCLVLQKSSHWNSQ